MHISSTTSRLTEPSLPSTAASEILAVNDHVFLVDERDGKGLGDGSSAKVKKVFMVDLVGAIEVSGMIGSTDLSATAVPKTLFPQLRHRARRSSRVLTPAQIPAKLEGMAFGDDVVIGDVTNHTLYISNDNDFDTHAGNPNRFFVFAFGDSDLHGEEFVPQVFVK